jgi:hypothetical protein
MLTPNSLPNLVTRSSICAKVVVPYLLVVVGEVSARYSGSESSGRGREQQQLTPWDHEYRTGCG